MHNAIAVDITVNDSRYGSKVRARSATRSGIGGQANQIDPNMNATKPTGENPYVIHRPFKPTFLSDRAQSLRPTVLSALTEELTP